MKILLACNAGMSTGIMENLLKECAKKDGVNAVIEAAPLSEINSQLENTDVILLGPQVRFSFPEIKKMAGPDIDVMTISAQDFGLMKADNVWEQVKAAMKAKGKM